MFPLPSLGVCIDHMLCLLCKEGDYGVFEALHQGKPRVLGTECKSTASRLRLKPENKVPRTPNSEPLTDHCTPNPNPPGEILDPQAESCRSQAAEQTSRRDDEGLTRQDRVSY
eukprot:CAMPEP_0114120100 /NCGR_PEP_ID=MMETSP0043_2-20121206/6466_1 /TAXON_ID=464988 /ORGANISM="Hemiselmis andersenii, Strain CCMP644" /LENGTH=112 /DNA_ID=CAMNT_0001212695 /DNA_START=322 /DNA_END=657 /DNA_ORIENTATION=+